MKKIVCGGRGAVVYALRCIGLASCWDVVYAQAAL